MPDKDKLIKVITALEHCQNMTCNTCPYMDNGKGGWDCRTMQEDAVDLLLKQKEEIEGLIVESASSAELAEGYAELLKEQPQIVRCKDCKHGQLEEWDNGECVDKTVYCDGYGIHIPNWFCADGERKSE